MGHSSCQEKWGRPLLNCQPDDEDLVPPDPPRLADLDRSRVTAEPGADEASLIRDTLKSPSAADGGCPFLNVLSLTCHRSSR